MSMLALAIRRKTETSWMLKGRACSRPFFLSTRRYRPAVGVAEEWPQKRQPEGRRYVGSRTRLVAEDAGWVGAGGAPGGEEAGSEGGEGHYDECGGEGYGVARTYLEEEIAE